MTSNGDVIARWVDYQQGKATRLRNGGSCSVIADEHTLYSYGRHFPMVEMYEPDGEKLALLNGDRYSNTTSHHQGQVRSAVQWAGWRSIIVPFSALDAAGIVHESIVPIEVTQDTNIEHDHKVLPEDAPIGHWTYEQWCSGNEHYAWCSRNNTRVKGSQPCGCTWVPPKPDADGYYHWTTWEHRLGEAVFKARFERRRQSQRMCRGPFTGDYRTARMDYERLLPPITSQATRTWWRPCQHGFSEPHYYNVTERGTAVFLSGFDHQESPPAYFLAQLPDEGKERAA